MLCAAPLRQVPNLSALVDADLIVARLTAAVAHRGRFEAFCTP